LIVDCVAAGWLLLLMVVKSDAAGGAEMRADGVKRRQR